MEKDFTLRLLVTTIKKTLDLDDKIHIQACDLVNLHKERIGTRITLDFYNADFWKYINKWASWKNAYKYRKKR